MKAPCLKCKEYKIKESGFIRTMERLTAELTLAKEVMQHDREYIDELQATLDGAKLFEQSHKHALTVIKCLTAENEQLASEMADQGPCINGLRDKVVSLTAENAALKEGLDGWHARYLDCEVERDAAYAAGREAMRQEWQPIETAPKDGSSYLVWAGGVGMAHYVDHYRSGYPHKAPFSENLAAWKEKATHWMPLPEKPE